MSQDIIANSFRRWGYLQAQIDTLGRIPAFPHPELDQVKAADAKKWRSAYCGSIGVEFMHMPFHDRCMWIAERMEASTEVADQKEILRQILEIEVFERFLHTRYVGVTRFSIEGCAALIPLLDSILTTAAENGFESVIMGMSHRARLAVMHAIVGASVSNIIACFEDIDPKSVLGRGDVKYHKGATGTYETRSGKSIRIHLASNPSHLESVNPVILGRTKAKQQRLSDAKYSKVLAVILHGDAAFAGQGIAAETLNFSNLEGFHIGGTVHIIINNLIGFTELPSAFLSSRYSTDIAKRLPIPIWHVNAEDPDAVVHVGKMAMDYRKQFESDVVVDLIGYRRHGHNEGDDPTLTQPLLYAQIQKRPPLYQSYAEAIKMPAEEVKKLEKEMNDFLASEREKGLAMTQQPVFSTSPPYWDSYVGGWYQDSLEVDTRVSSDKLLEITKRITEMPANFSIHAKVKKVLEQRHEMGSGAKPIDWGMAEALAIGSLLWDGTPVRFTGQDCRRGTFSHRHAVLIDTKTADPYIPLAHLHSKQAWFSIYDSMLSEAAAIGFEYGFTRDYPEALVCWEAQFGDFVNGAQTIIDQFMTAGEDKWGLLSGLVLLLPHGYEGRGPEHTSARIERFLQLAGEDNIQVCYPTTSAQYFHLLRRQALRKWRKPLIVLTPKSYLRDAAAASPIAQFAEGKFHTVIDEPNRTYAERVIICTGKIAHELNAERTKRDEQKTAIIRLEQLYPFPERELREALAKYSDAKSIVWVQEEPANMGALFYVRPYLERFAEGKKIRTVKRFQSASPSTGSGKAHALEQETIRNLAFANY